MSGLRGRLADTCDRIARIVLGDQCATMLAQAEAERLAALQTEHDVLPPVSAPPDRLVRDAGAGRSVPADPPHHAGTLGAGTDHLSLGDE